MWVYVLGTIDTCHTVIEYRNGEQTCVTTIIVMRNTNTMGVKLFGLSVVSRKKLVVMRMKDSLRVAGKAVCVPTSKQAPTDNHSQHWVSRLISLPFLGKTCSGGVRHVQKVRC